MHHSSQVKILNTSIISPIIDDCTEAWRDLSATAERLVSFIRATDLADLPPASSSISHTEPIMYLISSFAIANANEIYTCARSGRGVREKERRNSSSYQRRMSIVRAILFRYRFVGNALTLSVQPGSTVPGCNEHR